MLTDAEQIAQLRELQKVIWQHRQQQTKIEIGTGDVVALHLGHGLQVCAAVEYDDGHIGYDLWDIEGPIDPTDRTPSQIIEMLTQPA